MVMLGLLIVAYLQFVIMRAKLKKGLGMKRKCLCSKTTTVLSEWTIPNMYNVSILHIYCIINKYCIEMYVLYCT